MAASVLRTGREVSRYVWMPVGTTRERKPDAGTEPERDPTEEGSLTTHGPQQEGSGGGGWKTGQAEPLSSPGNRKHQLREPGTGLTGGHGGRWGGPQLPRGWRLAGCVRCSPVSLICTAQGREAGTLGQTTPVALQGGCSAGGGGPEVT